MREYSNSTFFVKMLCELNELIKKKKKKNTMQLVKKKSLLAIVITEREISVIE